MTLGPTLLRYWPWWVALLWLGGYELVAVFSGGRVTTLSRLAWTAEVSWPPVAHVSLGLVLILLFHFWKKNRLKDE